MIDPAAVGDEHGEWIELHNRGPDPIELRGWRLLSANDAGFTIDRMLTLAPDDRLTLARDGDTGTNGGVRAESPTAARSRSPTAATGGAAHARRPHRRQRRVARRTEGVALTPHPVADTSGRIPVVPPPVDSARPPADSQPGAGGPAPLIVRVLDVGQGDAILITNGGSRVLVDGGPDPARMGRRLDSLGLRGQDHRSPWSDASPLRPPQLAAERLDRRRQIGVRYFFENANPTRIALAMLRDGRARRARQLIVGTPRSVRERPAHLHADVRGGAEAPHPAARPARHRRERPLPASSWSGRTRRRSP